MNYTKNKYVDNNYNYYSGRSKTLRSPTNFFFELFFWNFFFFNILPFRLKIDFQKIVRIVQWRHQSWILIDDSLK